MFFCFILLWFPVVYSCANNDSNNPTQIITQLILRKISIEIYLSKQTVNIDKILTLSSMAPSVLSAQKKNTNINSLLVSIEL